MQEKIDFLGRLRVFEGLTPAELVDLADICSVFRFARGNIIAYQRDVADKLLIVRAGRLIAYTVDDSGVVANTVQYNAGDYLRDEWLVAPAVHSATIRAAADGELYTIDNVDFLHFLDKHPDVELDLSDTAWAELDRGRAAPPSASFARFNLLPGELVEYESRRTQLLLIVELGIPLLLAIGLPLGVVLLARSLEFGINWVVVTLAVLLFVVMSLLAVYRFLDWYNDYLLITNKHLVHKEFSLRTFQGQVYKLPLDQIQSMRVQQPNVIERLLGIGTVRVTTASQKEGLVFDKLSDPARVERTLTQIRQRERTLDVGRTRAEVRQVLEGHFKVPAQLVPVQADGAGAGGANAGQRARPRPQRLRRRGDRVEVGDSIIYGRHWIVLLGRMWWVLLLIALTIVGTIALWRAFPVTRIPFTYVASAFFLLIEAFLVVYYVENWRNDLFQVTGDLIVDIDRGPFGLTESRKTAQIVNIQNVRTSQPNLWAALFGYGDVIVDTAGASAEIIFENVANPARVQADIFERREQLVRRARTRDASARRQEVALILEEYQLLNEQRKIPLRTPPPDADSDEGGAAALLNIPE